MSDFDRCILILVDGARADVFAELLAAGELPNCKALFADRGGFQRGTTAMPSVSGPAHLPPITGCYPGRSNIPGIRWFDRQRYAQSAFQGQRVRSYMGLNKTARMNREVSATTPSMWESFPDGAAMFCWFTRGLQPGGNLTRGAKVTSWIKGAVTRKWEAGDAASGERLLAAARGDWPFVFTVFPTIDELGFPHAIQDLAMRERGLVLVVGAAGNGKSTKIAMIAMTTNNSTSVNALRRDMTLNPYFRLNAGSG